MMKKRPYTITFQKHTGGKTWRVIKHSKVARIQVYDGPFWINADANHLAVVKQSKALEFGQLRNAAKQAGVVW
jgi:hypothetical protein